MAYQFTQTGAEIQDILDLAQLQIAAPYDAGTSYTAGMYCTKDDGFYVANASTSGTWDGSKWTAVTVGDVLTSINTNLTQLSNDFTVNAGARMLFAISAGGRPYWRWTLSDGTIHQFSMTDDGQTLRYQYYDGANWTLIKSWS